MRHQSFDFVVCSTIITRHSGILAVLWGETVDCCVPWSATLWYLVLNSAVTTNTIDITIYIHGKHLVMSECNACSLSSESSSSRSQLLLFLLKRDINCRCRTVPTTSRSTVGYSNSYKSVVCLAGSALDRNAGEIMTERYYIAWHAHNTLRLALRDTQTT